MSRAPAPAAFRDSRRVGSIRQLATHSYDYSRLQIGKSLLDTWQQWSEVVNVVARRHHNDHTDAEARQVLLVLDALIDRQQCVELPVRHPEQSTIPDARPTEVLNRFRLMVPQFSFEPLRNALIEKKAHESRVA